MTNTNNKELKNMNKYKDLRLNSNDFFEKYKREKTFAINTLGCKVNQYESEIIRELFIKEGYQYRNFDEEADIYIVNTCTVTNVADKKSRQMLRRAKKKNPNSLVVAIGCYVQVSKKELDELEYVDLTISNTNKNHIVHIIKKFLEDGKQEKNLDESYPLESLYEDVWVIEDYKRSRATIKIQDGCNMYCSFCIIPYARGNIRSRRPGKILREIRGLAQKGYKEYILTGIHISSYGKDISDDLLDLIKLIEQISKIRGVDRIRIGSLEPRIINDDFLKKLKEIEAFCPHFHLSLQSGSDKILSKMRRRYNKAQYRSGVELIRKYYPRAAITTDVIVGFPGESLDDHEESKAFIKEMNFSDIHVFKYSKRNGTRAAKMPEQISGDEKAKRSKELIDLADKMKSTYINKFIGEECQVIFEQEETIGGQLYITGHTKEYIKVYCKADQVKDYRGIKDINRTNQLMFIKEAYKDGARGNLIK